VLPCSSEGRSRSSRRYGKFVRITLWFGWQVICGESTRVRAINTASMDLKRVLVLVDGPFRREMVLLRMHGACPRKPPIWPPSPLPCCFHDFNLLFFAFCPCWRCVAHVLGCRTEIIGLAQPAFSMSAPPLFARNEQHSSTGHTTTAIRKGKKVSGTGIDAVAERS
jgi:hypothetical protein